MTPGAKKDGRPVAVREVMKPNPAPMSPQTRRRSEAIEIMRKYKVGCLPVVTAASSVGIVTEYDFVAIATKLLEERAARLIT